jgi:hypothetical protein
MHSWENVCLAMSHVSRWRDTRFPTLTVDTFEPAAVPLLNASSHIQALKHLSNGAMPCPSALTEPISLRMMVLARTYPWHVTNIATTTAAATR